MVKTFSLLIIIFGQAAYWSATAQTETVKDTSAYQSPFFIRNERCLKCHGEQTYSYTTPGGLKADTIMPQDFFTGREAFYSSSHKSFKCTDCHSDEFSLFPHFPSAKEEIHFACIDCHGGDPAFAQYRFEKIVSEYEAGVHFRLEKEGFSCWSCHDPHSYRKTFRISVNKSDAIGYDNAICLKCHSGNALQKHRIFQDPGLHFETVGCLECHTRPDDSLMVAHLVTPKEKAYRNCKECHSKHSKSMIIPSLNGPGGNNPGTPADVKKMIILFIQPLLISFIVALFLMNLYLYYREINSKSC